MAGKQSRLGWRHPAAWLRTPGIRWTCIDCSEALREQVVLARGIDCGFYAPMPRPTRLTLEPWNDSEEQSRRTLALTVVCAWRRKLADAESKVSLAESLNRRW